MKHDGKTKEAVADKEEALRQVSAYNRSLIEASLDPLVTISVEGKIMDVNAAAEQITGRTRSELIGTDFADNFTDPGEARRGYQRAFSEGSVRDYALEVRHRDGRLTPVLYNASVYRDEKGKVLGVFAAARDITELKRAEEKARAALEQLREQQKAYYEVSTPVVNIWSKILMVPLIGIFDARRAQLLMETLLQGLEAAQARVAILDISGIPVMDTLVAKHLLSTVSAAQLMGAECIITGIRPGISQTLVHLGIDLAGVETKTTLADGLETAFNLAGLKVSAQEEGAGRK
jgi:PAS domain S-box-containing protein